MLYSFFSALAWPMPCPTVGGNFHLLLTASGSAAAVWLACFFYQKNILSPEKLIFSCGMILLISELIKQGFLFFIVFNRQFNWWYFPFQLCSIPMYLCLLYPAAAGHGLSAPILVFLQDFGLLGGIMALIVPEGFLWPYWLLTLHGFFWHFLLIFLGLYCHFHGVSSFFYSLPIYFFCAATAIFINTGVQLRVYPESYADMFYINCFFPSEQPLFSEISRTLGNFWGHLAYVLASCIGAGGIHFFLRLSPPAAMR